MSDYDITKQAMHHREKRTALEQDALTGWRRLYCYTQRAGVVKSAKQDSNRRERRAARRAMR